MATFIRDGFLSPQVWVAKRETKVIEILDRLTPARVEYAENIFGIEKYKDENGNEKRQYSILTMAISDGKGSSRKTVKYNFSPNDFTALRRECEPSIQFKKPYSFERTKKVYMNGTLTFRTVTIRFEYFKMKNGQPELDSNGQQKVSMYPWYIGISERSGEPDRSKTKIVKELSNNKSYVLLSSGEYQSMIDSTCRYIDVFAMAFGVPLLREKAKIAAARLAEYQKKQGRN